jgi:RimJ/RimL family protein N-acetyltransferase
MLHVEPVTLVGKLVRLEPLETKHAEEIFAAAQEADIWTYMPQRLDSFLADVQNWIATTLDYQKAGTVLPFAIRNLATGKICGSTRYLAITPQDHGLEIGWTWLDASARRTGINTECKYLLLQHAFETLGAIRVQLKTDSRNLRSQNAIERIGGLREGVLRNHMILPDGYYRDSVYFSIIESEWPGVKTRLQKMVAR